MPKRSIFFTLSNAIRAELLAKHDVHGWEKNQVFDDLSRDAWWFGEDGFHEVPTSYGEDCVQHFFDELEDDAQALADAVFAAKKQHPRVVDVCLIFLDTHAGALKTLCLYQVRPREFVDMTGEMTVLAAARFLNGTLGELDQESVWDQFRDDFPVWSWKFILELLKWKAPDFGGQTGGDVPPDSGSENGGAPTP